jgi:hypothetical protein
LINIEAACVNTVTVESRSSAVFGSSLCVYIFSPSGLVADALILLITLPELSASSSMT